MKLAVNHSREQSNLKQWIPNKEACMRSEASCQSQQRTIKFETMDMGSGAIFDISSNFFIRTLVGGGRETRCKQSVKSRTKLPLESRLNEIIDRSCTKLWNEAVRNCRAWYRAKFPSVVSIFQ